MGYLAYHERFVGIDVSRFCFEVDMYPHPNARRFGNVRFGHDCLARELVEYAPRLIAVGACGGEETPLVAALEASQLCVAVINPREARRFAEAIGLLTRTNNRIDAQVLARYAHAIRPENLRNQACIIFEEFLLKKIYMAWPA